MKVKIATAETHNSAHSEMKRREKEKDKEESIALSTRLSLHAGAAQSDLWADLLVKYACQGCITFCFAQKLQDYVSTEYRISSQSPGALVTAPSRISLIQKPRKLTKSRNCKTSTDMILRF